MNVRMFALLLLAALVAANDYSTPKDCGSKCCDTSDFNNWPCKSWVDDHFTSMCRTLGGNKYSCECAPGFSGDDCAGGGEKAVDSKTEPCKAISCNGVGTACKEDADCTDVDNGDAEVCYKGNCAKKCTTDADCGHGDGAWSKCIMSGGVGHCDKTCVEHKENDIWIGHCSCNGEHKGQTCKESVHCLDNKGKDIDCHHGHCTADPQNKKPTCHCEANWEVETNNKYGFKDMCVIDTRCSADERKECFDNNAICSKKTGHVKCDCNPGFGKSKGKGDADGCDLVLTDSETKPGVQWQMHLLDAHNQVRALTGAVATASFQDERVPSIDAAQRYRDWAAARGKDTDFASIDKKIKPAKGMPKMVWSEALAANMAKHYKNNGCKMSHSTSSFRSGISTGNHLHVSEDKWNYVGENLAMTWGSGPLQTHTSDGCDYEATPFTGTSGCGAAEYDAVFRWFEENSLVTAWSPKVVGTGSIGHFTQVVWAKSKSVGCAYCKASDGGLHYGCQYGTGGNYGGQLPYEADGSLSVTRMIDPMTDEEEFRAFEVQDFSISSVGDAVSFAPHNSASVVVVVGVVVAIAVVAVAAAVVVVKRRRASEGTLVEELCSQ